MPEPDAPKDPAFTLDPPASPEETARAEAIAMLTLVYCEGLMALGVSSFILGVPLNESPNGQGALKCVGRADIILNLLAGIIRGLIPQDFDNLVTEMMFGTYFSAQRNAAKVLRAEQTPGPAGKPN